LIDSLLAQRESLIVYVALKIGDAVEAEEIVQQALVQALRALDAGHQPHAPAAWLRRIALNLIIDRARCARFRTNTSLESLSEMGWEQQSLDWTHRSLEREQLRRDVQCAVSELDEAQRETCILRYWHDMTIEEIATRLNIAEGTVKTRLFRARKRIEHKLHNYE
jgi:RNA polymerase sigma-70 factor (ECF subfamily)